jgi:hypothetical protein
VPNVRSIKEQWRANLWKEILWSSLGIMPVISWRFRRTTKNICHLCTVPDPSHWLHVRTFVAREPFSFVLNAVLHISHILVECCCQNQGPSTYDVEGALRKILGNDGYNTSQNLGIRYQFSYDDVYNTVLCLIHFNASKSQLRKYLCLITMLSAQL